MAAFLWGGVPKQLISGVDLKHDEKIYIHCKGGHGRVGIAVASLLCYIKNISVEESLKLTNECHKKREIMKEKWRNIGSPQTYNQKKFS